MAIPTCCFDLELHTNGEDTTVVFVRKFREYGIPVQDGGNSYILIRFCPWCAAELPASVRDKWFASVARLGIDPYDGPIPETYMDERWYSSQT